MHGMVLPLKLRSNFSLNMHTVEGRICDVYQVPMPGKLLCGEHPKLHQRCMSWCVNRSYKVGLCYGNVPGDDD